MEFLLDPNVAYLLAVATVMLFILTTIVPGSMAPKVGAVLCLLATVYELIHLNWNSWALSMVVLSPLPFFLPLGQTRPRLSFLIFTVFMLTVGSLFLFVDEKGQLVVNFLLAGGVSIACGQILWNVFGRSQYGKGTRLVDAHHSMVGLIGKAQTEIEVHGTGSVEVEGEVWIARSQTFIPAGSTVRILRQDGPALTVKKVEKITKE